MAIIVVASFFFVFLGMRIPYIKGDFHKPKQRPRAVVENVIKLRQAVCQENLKQNHTQVVVEQHEYAGVADAEVPAAVRFVPPFYLQEHIAKRLSPRAPPRASV